MQYLGWTKPSDCITFEAWMYWECYSDYYSGQKYYRFFGFQFLIQQENNMAGSATWRVPCSMCSGNGKIQVWDKKNKKVLPSIDCPACNGTGDMMVKKNMLRKKN